MPPNRTRSAFPMWITLLALLAGAALAFTMAGTGQASPSPEREPEPDRYEPGPQELHLNGTVVDEDGQRLDGVELVVENHWVNRSDEEDDERGAYRQTVTTDEAGFYALDVSEGHVEIRVDEDGYQRLHAEFEIDEDRTVELPMRGEHGDGARLEVNVRVDGAPIEAHVSVREAEDEGRAVSEERTVRKTGDGVHLSYRSTLRNHAYERTGENGTANVELEPGTYRIQARADDHIRDEATVELEANETTSVELAPIPVPASTLELEGVVRDADTGEPVPGARVTAVNDRWGERARVYADADGRWNVSLPPGPVLVSAEADRDATVPCQKAPEGAEPAYRDRCRLERDPGYLRRVASANGSAGDTVEVDLHLQPARTYDATLSGWVVNETSQEGVADATVIVHNEVTGDWGRAETDANGSFSIDVQAGYYTVLAQHPDHPAGAENVRVDAGEEERFALEVPPGPNHQDRRYHTMPSPRYAHDGIEETAAEGDGADDGGSSHVSDGAGAPDGSPTYEGSGGGLGAYTAEREGSAQAPGLGTLGVLGALATVGLGTAALGVHRPRER